MRVLKASKQRTEEDRSKLREAVSQMIQEVRERGDEALIEYNRKFDQCERAMLRVSEEEIKEAYKQVSKQEIADIESAAANIEAFAKAQRETVGELKDVSPAEGIYLGHRVIPVESIPKRWLLWMWRVFRKFTPWEARRLSPLFLMGRNRFVLSI